MFQCNIFNYLNLCWLQHLLTFHLPSLQLQQPLRECNQNCFWFILKWDQCDLSAASAGIQYNRHFKIYESGLCGVSAPWRYVNHTWLRRATSWGWVDCAVIVLNKVSVKRPCSSSGSLHTSHSACALFHCGSTSAVGECLNEIRISYKSLFILSFNATLSCMSEHCMQNRLARQYERLYFLCGAFLQAFDLNLLCSSSLRETRASTRFDRTG